MYRGLIATGLVWISAGVGLAQSTPIERVREQKRQLQEGVVRDQKDLQVVQSNRGVLNSKWQQAAALKDAAARERALREIDAEMQALSQKEQKINERISAGKARWTELDRSEAEIAERQKQAQERMRSLKETEATLVAKLRSVEGERSQLAREKSESLARFNNKIETTKAKYEDDAQRIIANCGNRGHDQRSLDCRARAEAVRRDGAAAVAQLTRERDRADQWNADKLTRNEKQKADLAASIEQYRAKIRELSAQAAR